MCKPFFAARGQAALCALALLSLGCGRDQPHLPRPSLAHNYELGETISFATGGDSARFRTTGWSSPEETGTWTDGPVAAVALRILPTAAPLLLRIRMHAQTKPPEVLFQPLVVHVNGQSVASWQVADEAVFTALVPREIAAEGGLLTIELHFPQATTSAEREEANEGRRVGIHCRELTLSVSATPPDSRVYTPGTPLRFGSGGDVDRFLVYGWSEPESGWQWTDGTAAAMEFEMPPVNEPLVVRAKLSGAANPPALPFQPTDVFANGRQIGHWEVAELAEFEATIPAEIAARGGTLALEFRMPRAASPKELGLGEDQRVLALRWYEVNIGTAR